MKIDAVDSIQVRLNNNGSKTFYFGGQNDSYSPGQNNTWLFRIHLTLSELADKPRKELRQLIMACCLFNYLLFRR